METLKSVFTASRIACSVTGQPLAIRCRTAPSTRLAVARRLRSQIGSSHRGFRSVFSGFATYFLPMKNHFLSAIHTRPLDQAHLFQEQIAVAYQTFHLPLFGR